MALTMNKIQKKLIEILTFFSSDDVQAITDKKELSNLLTGRFNVKQHRSLFIVDDSIAIRFSHSKTAKNTSSNTVLAIKKINELDDYPILSVLVTPGTNYVEIMNTTFIKKVSHSSKKIANNNLVGSINYSDITKEFRGIPNSLSNIACLYSIHEKEDHWQNLKRIVNATQKIKPAKHKYAPDENAKGNIYSAIDRLESFIEGSNLMQIEANLDVRVNAEKKYILSAAQSYDHNVNLRGRIIEKLVSGTTNDIKKIKESLETNKPLSLTTKDALADYQLSLDKYNVAIDIKSSVLEKESQPKGVYIDDMLQFLGQANTIFLIYLVGIQLENKNIVTKLVPIFDQNILKGSHIENAWSGRDTRGHIQFNGNSMHAIETDTDYHINIMPKDDFKEYIDMLIRQ